MLPAAHSNIAHSNFASRSLNGHCRRMHRILRSRTFTTLLFSVTDRIPSCLLVRNFMGYSVGILMIGGRDSVNEQQLMIIDWTVTPDKWEIKTLNDW